MSDARNHTFRCPRCGKEMSYDAGMDMLWCPDPECGMAVRRTSTGGTGQDSAGYASSGGGGRGSARWPVEPEDAWPEEPPRRGRKALIFLGAIATVVAVLAMVYSPLLWPKRPVISISPDTVSFNDFSGDGALPQAFAIQNDGKGALEWSIDTDASWLTIQPLTGTLEEGVQVVTLRADIGGMAPGTYEAICTVSGVRAYNTPQEVNIVLELREPPEARAMKEMLGENVELFYGLQPPYVSGPTGTEIELLDNDAAADGTWDALVQFLVEDYTDESPYIEDLQMCGSFAETLHNNAEAAGIRSAWVSIDILGQEVGHALNAFVTTDRGLVFVDCTGEDASAVSAVGGDAGTCDYDKAAYVQVGKPYGLVSIEYAESSSYVFYERYLTAWESYVAELEDYNALVDEYNTLVGGRTLVAGSAEARRAQRLHGDIQSRRIELEIQQEVIGQCQWTSVGTVERIEIYW